MAKPRVIDKDLGFDLLKRRIAEASGLRVQVGIFGGKPHQKAQGLTVAEVAAANEYGTDRIPARPAFRRALDGNRQGLQRRIEKETQAIVDNTRTPEQAFGRLGLYVQGLVQKSIVDLRDPPNAPSTIKAKGSTNPLVDTGQYKNSVTFRVVRAGALQGSQAKARRARQRGGV